MISYHYFPDDQFILSIFYGEVTSQELHELIDKLQTIEQKDGGMRGLNILCKNIKPKGIKASDIMNAGERMKNVSFRKNGKNAIITKTLLAYGLSRIYKVATDILNLDELKIYKEKELADAIEWLDVTEMEEEICNIINQFEQSKK